MSHIIPINNGYYNYKSINGQIYKACVQKSIYQNVNSNSDRMMMDGENYLIGVGNPTLEMDKTLSVSNKLLILNMLCRLTSEKKETFKLLLSCPPLSYAQQSEELPEYLMGKYKIQWNGMEREINIEEVKVFPETFVAFLPNNADGRYNNKIVFIIDIGGFTTNICKIEYGSFGGNDFRTIQHGMYHLDSMIAQYLNSKYINLNCKIEEIEHFRKYGLFINGDKENYWETEKEQIEAIYSDFIEKIIYECKTKGWNINAHEVLVIGGGGMILYPYIKGLFLNQAVLSNNPIFDNLNGLNLLKDEVYGK